MKVSFAARTDLGLKRQNNEDTFYADEKNGLFMVLDGIGGHQAGEVASQLGGNTIKEDVLRNLRRKRIELVGDYNHNFSRETNILMNGLILANKAIYEVAASETDYQGMGTTVASLLLGKRIVSIAHVGDSRIYRIQNHAIERLTEDHSLVREQVRHGMITEQEAETSDMKNIITRALGASSSVDPGVDEFIPFKNDIYLLCSDGLTDLVNDEEILDLVWKNQSDLGQACQTLIDRANAEGGKDNATIILVRVKEPSSKTSFRSWFFFRWLDRILQPKNKPKN